jgi:hypothetical protein
MKQIIDKMIQKVFIDFLPEVVAALKIKMIIRHCKGVIRKKIYQEKPSGQSRQDKPYQEIKVKKKKLEAVPFHHFLTDVKTPYYAVIGLIGAEIFYLRVRISLYKPRNKKESRREKYYRVFDNKCKKVLKKSPYSASVSNKNFLIVRFALFGEFQIKSSHTEFKNCGQEKDTYGDIKDITKVYSDAYQDIRKKIGCKKHQEITFQHLP